MADKLRNLEELQVGDRFFIPGLERRGTVNTLSRGGVTVTYDKGTESSFTTAEGQEVSFRKKERVMISRKTRVVKLMQRRRSI